MSLLLALLGGGAQTFTLVADSGSYLLTGTSANLLYNRKILADGGVYLLTGSDVSLRYNRRLLADSGGYSLTGNEVTLTYQQGTPLTLRLKPTWRRRLWLLDPFNHR